MKNIKEIGKSIYYVGVNDHDIDLFEGQFFVPLGMSYNSYVVCDNKNFVFDSVDASFADEWIENVKKVLDKAKPDYLVVQHVEPDHSGSVKKFLEAFPETTVIGNAKTFVMLEQFFGKDIAKNRLTVVDGQTVESDNHAFTFVFAPFVHWPEVMLTYDAKTKTLFSADAFGKFGAVDYEDDWTCEARRYYFGIVGKYGMQVQNLLKKARNLDIETICPLHGPILTENISYYLDKYNTWSNYDVESEGVVIAYSSVYGNTKQAVEYLRDKLLENGCEKVVVADLARNDLAETVEDAFRYGKLVLASVTYNGDVFPDMKKFLLSLVERGYKKRIVAMIENGSWAPTAIKVMKNMLADSKELTFAENNVSIRSSMNEANKLVIDALAKELTTK